MSFKDIEKYIRSTYKSTNNDLILDFYNIVLSESVKYDRITGFFSSSSLAVAASGIVNLIDNNGHMRLLCGSTLNEEDTEAILNADDLKNLINSKFLKDIDNIENKIIDDHVKILGWMVANNILEIKIGVKKTKNGYNSSNMLHSKIGILYDSENNIITFDGSVNESANGWVNNIESIKVFKSWEDYKFMQEDIHDFDKYWNGEEDSLEVFDIPEASKQSLIKKAPNNRQDLEKIINKLKNLRISINKEQRQLFKHQQEAINFWVENSFKGIFEMATGTGKTFTALKSIEKLLEKDNQILTIIASPQSHISVQWINEINNMDFANCHNFFGSVNNQWYKELSKLITRINLNVFFNKPNIICTTHKAFSDEKFIKLIQSVKKKCIIIDEMHHVGSKKLSEGLLESYDYRLGLSATPSRYMDEEGTEKLLNYFNNNIFSFSLKDALTSINEITGETFLTPYNYYPYKVELTPKEEEDYINLTRSILISYNSKKINKKNIEKLVIKRKKIINNAINKYEVFKKILDEIEDKNHLIVFCSDKQINPVLKILNEKGFTRHRFTEKEKSKSSKKYKGLSQREKILKEFDDGDINAIVAIKCLDEGVDVPSANKVIIMSSSTNPIEYVQRRGRVLRRYKNKKIANIYDLIVFPNKNGKFNTLKKNEFNRLNDFIETANNKLECFKLLDKWGVI